MTEDPQLAARLQRAMEPYQSMVYMVPEGPTEYAAIGLDPGQMGTVTGTNAVEATAITDAMGVLKQQGYTGTTVKIAIDAVKAASQRCEAFVAYARRHAGVTVNEWTLPAELLS